jgi:hypothetical protein
MADIFPLPLPSRDFVTNLNGAEDTLVTSFVHLTILSLNFLWDNCSTHKCAPYTGRPTAAQLQVHVQVTHNVMRLLQRVGALHAKARGEDTTAEMPDLVASKVEMGDHACTCDSSRYLPDDLREMIMAETAVFGDLVGQKPWIPRFCGKSREEYASLTARGLQNGRLCLRPDVCGGG